MEMEVADREKDKEKTELNERMSLEFRSVSDGDDFLSYFFSP